MKEKVVRGITMAGLEAAYYPYVLLGSEVVLFELVQDGEQYQ